MDEIVMIIFQNKKKSRKKNLDKTAIKISLKKKKKQNEYIRAHCKKLKPE